MSDFTVKIDGLDELVKKMQALPEDLQRKGLRFGLRKAAVMIADKARERATAENIDDPETARSIIKNIDVRFSPKTLRKTGDLMFRIGIAGTARFSGQKADLSAGAATPHWRLIEFGSVKSRAKPFMRPAMNEGARDALDIFATEANKAIDRAVKRLERGV